MLYTNNKKPLNHFSFSPYSNLSNQLSIHESFKNDFKLTWTIFPLHVTLLIRLSSYTLTKLWATVNIW